MENSNIRKLIFLGLPMIFSLAMAITLAACMAQADRGITDSVAAGQQTPPQAAEKLSAPSAQSKLAFTSNGDGSCYVSGIGGCTDETVVIPERSPAGDEVTAIGDNAFLGSETIRNISFPQSLKKIGAYAFYGSSLEGVTIIESITEIGDAAFGSCQRLISITVDSANANYSGMDGVLFSKDKCLLICYPSGKIDEKYTVRRGVSEISTMAFHNCVCLSAVAFNGTETEWARIKVGGGNESLTSLTVTFTKTVK